MTEYKVILEDLPTTIGGYVKKTGDFYDIVLNSRQSHSKNLKTYREEINHIRNRDHDRQCSADQIEKEAHRRD